MDHKEQHHEHHRKEREEKKEHRKEHEHIVEKTGRRIHPAWFLVTGIVLIGLVVATWTFFL